MHLFAPSLKPTLCQANLRSFFTILRVAAVWRTRLVVFFEPNVIQQLLIRMIEAFERLSLTSSQYYGEISSKQFSQHLLEVPPIRKLDSLLIHNFKSFKGKVYVGPLLDFTSIIGPNGAGKSNILDALMFCLCNERSKLSFYDLREFIHRDGEETYGEMGERGKHCEVEAVFVVENGRTLTFRRTLFPDERRLQQFAIDGEQYSQRLYENYLMRCNLNYITANYAIWQGEVDKLLLKSPKELTALFETVSGSAFFKHDQLQLKQELEEVEERVQAETAKLVKLRIQLKNIKKLHNTKGNSEQSQAEYEACGKKILMARMLLGEAEIKGAEREVEGAEKEERRRVREVTESKIRMQREQAERINVQNRLNLVMKEVAQKHTLLKSMEQSANILEVQTFKELQNELLSLRRYADTLTARSAALQQEALALQSLDVDKEYLALFGQWEKENEVITKQLAKKKTEYVYSEELLRTKRTLLTEFHHKLQRAEKHEQETDAKRREMEANVEELGKNIGRMKIEQGRLSQEYLNSKGRLDDRLQKLFEMEDKIAQLEGLLSEHIENQKDRALVKVLSSVDGYRGLVEEVVSPANKKYEACFQIMMGALLKHILSADEQASKSIAAKLREHGKMRTVIILANVREKKEQISRSALGKQAHLAIETVEFEKAVPHLSTFLQEYLSGKVICENMEAAWSLLGQSIRGVREIYTLDGNVLRQDGMVSTYGSLQAFTKKYKYVNDAKHRKAVADDIHKLQREKAAIEEEVKALKEKASEERIARHNSQLAKLEGRREELAATLAMMKKAPNGKAQVKLPAGLEREVEELERRVGGIRESMKEMEKEMVTSKIFTGFLRKNNINNLDSFRSLEDLSSLEAKMRQKSKAAREIEEIERETAKVAVNIASKEERLQRLAARVNAAASQQRKGEVMLEVKRGEQEMAALRSQLNSMSSISAEALKFKSQLPQMESKLALLKERYDNMVKAELAQLGLENPPEQSQFKQLNEHLTVPYNRAGKEHLAEALNELTNQMKILQSLLEKQLLDLSAFEQTGTNKEKLELQAKQIESALEECNQERARISDKLESVKKDRKSLFMNFFNTLSPILLRTYQMLTENKDGVPGKVELYLQNQEFPCDDGVYFFPTPPTKRFVYDLDQLSGGEKSLASLALQYSIAIASKSPFLMLDEIDAFLDSTNVGKFMHLVNESIREKALQFVLVTHKRSLFLHSQSLVGVSKTKSNPFSKAYSLLLDESAAQERP